MSQLQDSLLIDAKISLILRFYLTIWEELLVKLLSQPFKLPVKILFITVDLSVNALLKPHELLQALALGYFKVFTLPF